MKKKKPFDPRRDRKGDDARHHLENEQRKRSTMEGLASVAAMGDKEAAMIMLRYADYYIWKAEGIPEPVRGYLAECFARALRDESTEFAFNLKQPGKGNSKPFAHHREWRDWQLAQGVADYHDENGGTLTEAYNVVADGPQPMVERLGRAGFSAVKAAYLRYFPKEKKDKKERS